MRGAKVLGILLMGLALASACNDNSVNGDTSPTPTPTGSNPTPTPTGTSANNIWNITPSPASQPCGFETESFVGVTQVPIDLTGGNFIPDWGLVTDPQVGPTGLVNAPSGTVTGNTFTSSWDYCRFDGVFSFRKEWTWTGTFANGGTTFTSTLTEVVHYGNGDLRSTCVSAAITPMGNCSSPGLTWSIPATKQ